MAEAGKGGPEVLVNFVTVNAVRQGGLVKAEREEGEVYDGEECKRSL